MAKKSDDGKLPLQCSICSRVELVRVPGVLVGPWYCERHTVAEVSRAMQRCLASAFDLTPRHP